MSLARRENELDSQVATVGVGHIYGDGHGGELSLTFDDERKYEAGGVVVRNRALGDFHVDHFASGVADWLIDARCVVTIGGTVGVIVDLVTANFGFDDWLWEV